MIHLQILKVGKWFFYRAYLKPKGKLDKNPQPSSLESKDSLEELKFSAEDIDIDVSLENSPDDFLEVSKKDAGCMTESFLDDW